MFEVYFEILVWPMSYLILTYTGAHQQMGILNYFSIFIQSLFSSNYFFYIFPPIPSYLPVYELLGTSLSSFIISTLS